MLYNSKKKVKDRQCLAALTLKNKNYFNQQKSKCEWVMGHIKSMIKTFYK